MTTGTVPNFVDVALNLGSSKIMEDNLLLQARDHDMKLIFYGDETWLKLFPNVFTRSEGTTSFFVSDFTEVNQLVCVIFYVKIKGKQEVGLNMNFS
jgi:ethanolaminephosphotransferase